MDGSSGSEVTLKEAMLKAADMVEIEGKYFFAESNIYPITCDSPMCLIGWVAAFKDGFTGNFVQRIAVTLLGVEEGVFYDRLCELEDIFNPRLGVGCPAWYNDHQVAAKVLRMYAEKYA